MKQRCAGAGSAGSRPRWRWLLVPVAALGAMLACGRAEVPDAILEDYARAKVDYEKGELASAADALELIVRKRGAFHQAAFLLGKTYYFEGRIEEAEKLFRQLTREHREYNEAGIWLARIALQKGDLEEARRLIEALLAFDQGDPRLQHLLGMVALQKGEVQAALASFQRATAFGEELARSHLESARLYYQFDQVDRAIAELRACINLVPAESLLRGPASRLLDTLMQERKRREAP
jgi:tetratricopeptide (TPR) repeat protein